MRPASARIASRPVWTPDGGPAPPSPYPQAAKRVVSDSARRAGPPGTEAAMRVRKRVERHPTHVDPPRESSSV
jgi:hypothetical protein